MLTRNLQKQLQVTSVQRGISHCIYAICTNIPLPLMYGYFHSTHYLVHCVQMCVCCPVLVSVLCIAQLCTHCAIVLLCRIPRRWWLKVSAGSYNTSLLPSSPIKQAEGDREMEGEVVFRRDTKSNLLKAVSGTEWMYRRRALERGRRVSVNAVVFVFVFVSAPTLKSQSIQYDVWSLGMSH